MEYQTLEGNISVLPDSFLLLESWESSLRRQKMKHISTIFSPIAPSPKKGQFHLGHKIRLFDLTFLWGNFIFSSHIIFIISTNGILICWTPIILFISTNCIRICWIYDYLYIMLDVWVGGWVGEGWVRHTFFLWVSEVMAGQLWLFQPFPPVSGGYSG